MPKWAAVGLGKGLADVDPDTVQNVYDEGEHGLPPKGPYMAAVKRLESGETGENSANAGAPKIVVLTEIAEPKGTKKSKYNGYGMWRHQVVSEESAGRVNQLLLALLDNSKLTAAKKKAVLAAFHDGNVVIGTKDNRGNAPIEKIGTWVVPEGMLVGIETREETYNDEKRLTVASFMPKSDAPKGKVVEDDDEPEDDPEEGEDDEVTARQEELEGMPLAKLKTVAKGLEIKIPRGSTEDDLVNLILDVEFPPVDEDEEEDEPEEDADEDEEDDDSDEAGEDELAEFDRAELKALIKDEGLEVKVLKSMSDDDLREAIRAAQGEAPEEEDEEDEPEPPKPTRKGRTAAKPAAKGRPSAQRRAGRGKDDPPF